MNQPILASHEYNEHPVFNPLTLHLDTPAIRKINEDVHRWIWTGSTGALIAGAARAGKTTALLTLADQLYTRGKVKIPTFFISIGSRDANTIASVFRRLCICAKLKVSNHDRADHLAIRFIHFIADAAVKANCQQVLLIVDEMQHLTAGQFDAFAELHDELARLQVSLTVIFVANDPECWSLIEQIEKPRYAHIHGRFFNQGAQLHGLTSKEDVRFCLAQYDTLHYPELGPSYTAFFVPEWVNEGWKLASLSSDIWRVFTEYKKNYKITSWGMKYFTAAINTLLCDFLAQQEMDEFDDEVFHECIRVSGLIPSLVRPKR